MLELTLRTTPPGLDETSTVFQLSFSVEKEIRRGAEGEKNSRRAEIGACIETVCNGNLWLRGVVFP